MTATLQPSLLDWERTLPAAPRFLGPDVAPWDEERLGRQLRAVWDCVRSGEWVTLAEVARATGAPEASVSARLRDLRRYGWTVERARAAEEGGTWRYRVKP